MLGLDIVTCKTEGRRNSILDQLIHNSNLFKSKESFVLHAMYSGIISPVSHPDLEQDTHARTSLQRGSIMITSQAIVEGRGSSLGMDFL